MNAQKRALWTTPWHSIRSRIRRSYARLLTKRAGVLPAQLLGNPAVVFAPHPDDETLGCGGTILLKKRMGVTVNVVFMTDGSSSHGHLMERDVLRKLRHREALAACEKLGVREEDVHFLDFKDGSLAESWEAAVVKVRAILTDLQPREIFIPCDTEPPPDHTATTRIVKAALTKQAHAITIFEYPIWVWDHWPWTNPWQPRLRNKRDIATNSLVSGFGLRILRDFRCAVEIRTVLEEKRAALAQHKTQMERMEANPQWLTLSDVSNGEFVDCFFRDYEFFRVYQYGGPLLEGRQRMRDRQYIP